MEMSRAPRYCRPKRCHYNSTQDLGMDTRGAVPCDFDGSWGAIVNLSYTGLRSRYHQLSASHPRLMAMIVYTLTMEFTYC